MRALWAAPSGRSRVAGRNVLAWYGIRYAHAPVRFAAAQAAAGRLEVQHLHEVPVFPQLPSRLAAAMGQGCPVEQDEDAFFLNIWAPEQAQGLPVLLFIHGGAWMTGGASMPWYDGANLAARGMVVVSANYRIGPLGHLGSPDAHALPLPAADLLLALQWVVENVQAFGGDTGRITVMGQSAGGWYAHLLSVLPQTQGMLERVALLSMGVRQPWQPQKQQEVTATAAERLGGRLQTATAHEVLLAGVAALPKEPVLLGHAPAAFLPVQSDDLPTQLLQPAWAAKACHAKAVYLRNTADECAAFFFQDALRLQATQSQVDDELSSWALADLPPQLRAGGRFDGAASGLSPYRQLVAAASWRQFQRFPHEYAEQLHGLGKLVQQARFDFESELEGFHGGHCLDLPFQFGCQAAWSDAPMLAGVEPDCFEAISSQWQMDVARFVSGFAEHSANMNLDGGS